MSAKRIFKLYARLGIVLLLAAGYLFLTCQMVNANRVGSQPHKFAAWPARPATSLQVTSPTRMVVSPTALYFTATLSRPLVMTHPITISNTGDETFTWKITVTVRGDLSGTLQPRLTISPSTGVNTGTAHVRVNSAGFAAGVFTSTLRISAEPASTAGSPFTMPVSLHVLDDWRRTFLPMVVRNDPPLVSPPTVSITTYFGLNFVNSAETPAGALRFQRAAEAGASWDRWPFYWGYIETSNGVFDWSHHDPAVILDVEHGLQLDAILMMPPAFHRKGPCGGLAASVYAAPPRIGPATRSLFMRMLQLALAESDCTTPASLDQPVFDDGTDIPSIDKGINPANPWARFVYTTAMRYKPGGVIAAQRHWLADQGVRVWEVWNEPDYPVFWNGNAADYARAVAVAYLAIKHADPQARVLLGGLSDTGLRPNWLQDTLDAIGTFPYSHARRWFFDSVAVHSYAWSWATWRQLYRAQEQLDSHSILSKTLWINESGVPVWDDYPGPEWDPNSAYRATMLEQADYVIQSAIYARWMNAEAVFHFQLHDDCGNGPDAHDAFGLRRNSSPAACYPSDEGARPSFATYRVMTRYLQGLTPKWRWRPPDAGEEWITFYNAAERKRVVALWSRTYVSQTAVLTATSTSAILVTPDGITQTLVAANGRYTLTLPAATNRNFPPDGPAPDGFAPIGGQTLLLIEPDPSGTGGPKPSALQIAESRLTKRTSRDRILRR